LNIAGDRAAVAFQLRGQVADRGGRLAHLSQQKNTLGRQDR
jgi:hypothetical protein